MLLIEPEKCSRRRPNIFIAPTVCVLVAFCLNSVCCDGRTLLCSPQSLSMTLNYQTQDCPVANTSCYVTGVDSQTDIKLDHSLVSNNGSSVLRTASWILPSGNTLFIEICKNSTTSKDNYQLLYRLQSGMSQSSFDFSIIVYGTTPVAGNTTQAPGVNTPVTVATTQVFAATTPMPFITTPAPTCPREVTESGLIFPRTPGNTLIRVNCPDKYTGQINRFCYLNQTWGSYNYNNCRRKDLIDVADMVAEMKKNISQLSPEVIADRLRAVGSKLADILKNSSTVLSGDIIQIVNILSDVGEITELYKTVKLDEKTLKDFVSSTASIIGADVKVWGEAAEEEDDVGAKLLDAMDNIIMASLRDETLVDEFPLVTQHLAMKRASSRDDIEFPNREEMGYHNYSGWVLQSNITAFLSKNAFGNTQGSVKYSVILYRNVTDKLKINQKLQTGSLSGKVLNSDILSFSLNPNVTTLSPPLVLNFSVQQTDYSDPSCGYLDTSASVTGVWATRGCTTEVIGDNVQCSCNHLTNFAVLMSPYGKTSSKDKAILSIISAIGCGISIFFLLITIIVYLTMWKYVKCDRSVLHINLSVCLILAYIAFLAGVDRSNNKIVCKIVAALLHYLFLVVFFIMLSEGIEIFKSVSFVFSSKSILFKLISFSYGVPMIIVAISLGLTKTEGYGSDTFCWLSTKGELIWAFVGPVLLVILINFILIIQVLRIMQNTKHMTDKSAIQRTKSVVRTICILSPILGITWVFGVLSVNEDTIIFQYLFTIFNSLQGLFIFICHCLLAPQVRDGCSAMKRKQHARTFKYNQKTVSSSFGVNSHFNSNKQKTNSQSSTPITPTTSSASQNSIIDSEQ